MQCPHPQPTPRLTDGTKPESATTACAAATPRASPVQALARSSGAATEHGGVMERLRLRLQNADASRPGACADVSEGGSARGSNDGGAGDGAEVLYAAQRQSESVSQGRFAVLRHCYELKRVRKRLCGGRIQLLDESHTPRRHRKPWLTLHFKCLQLKQHGEHDALRARGSCRAPRLRWQISSQSGDCCPATHIQAATLSAIASPPLCLSCSVHSWRSPLFVLYVLV